MAKDQHPSRWVGEAVHKLVVGRDGGKERCVGGTVVRYCPMSTQYLASYEDGSSEGIPLEDIDYHVPIARQLPVAKSCSSKRKAGLQQNTGDGWRPDPPPDAKRCKLPAPAAKETSPVLKGASALAFRFVRGFFWTLASAGDVGDSPNSRMKQKTLIHILGDNHTQPQVALAQYIEEGGLDVVHEALRSWVCGSADANEDAIGLTFLLKLLAEMPCEDSSRRGRRAQLAMAVKAMKNPREDARDDTHSLSTSAQWTLGEWKSEFTTAAEALGSSESSTEQVAPTLKPKHCSEETQPKATDKATGKRDPKFAKGTPAATPAGKTKPSRVQLSSVNACLGLTGGISCVGGRGGEASPKSNQQQVRNIALDALKKRQARRNRTKSTGTDATATSSPGSTQAKASEVVDLTCNDEQDEESVDSGVRRRLRFGENSTVRFHRERPAIDVRRGCEKLGAARVHGGSRSSGLGILRRKLAVQSESGADGGC
ncbi:hypothetical protein BBJ28_00017767 [Nothophytophthora sp. Chile5]|nr:hypothetical protein BBJ28_00017767 [Nothophytophthora sp. Chile5]